MIEYTARRIVNNGGFEVVVKTDELDEYLEFMKLAQHIIDFGVTTPIICTNWVSVNDGLPKKSGKYVTFSENENMAVLNYSARHKAFNTFDLLDDSNGIPCTHWMPLPNPPTE